MKRIAALVVLALALTTCSGSSRRSATPPSPASPATSATTVDPTVIPPVITIDYLNAVLAKLDHIYGDAVREFVAKRDVTPEVNVRLRAIYDDPLYQEQLKIFSADLAEGIQNDFANVRKPPGDRSTRAIRILNSTPTCVWMATSTDLSAVTFQPQGVAQSEYLAIRGAQTGHDPEHLNPTPWALSANFTYKTVTPPPADPCAGT